MCATFDASVFHAFAVYIHVPILFTKTLLQLGAWRRPSLLSADDRLLCPQGWGVQLPAWSIQRLGGKGPPITSRSPFLEINFLYLNLSRSHSRVTGIYLNYQTLRSPFHWPCSIPHPPPPVALLTRATSVTARDLVRPTGDCKTLSWCSLACSSHSWRNAPWTLTPESSNTASLLTQNWASKWTQLRQKINFYSIFSNYPEILVHSNY